MLYDLLKRFLDLIAAILGLVFASPILILAALAIKLDTQGPILADTPMRVGKNGQLFKMFKFRSMVVGAHQLLQQDPKLLKQYTKNSYKIQNDPRVTIIGRFIRKYSIDELPQLINILKGDMSIVGPRAYYPFELEAQQKKYPNSREFVKIILSAKPGLTGIWQVSGRSDINFDKRVEMDAHYVQRRSIFYDIFLIIKTIPAVLSGKGAI
ncbi:sugar transferase [Candidatus Daviesbacteria bacterium]|nr:sugar transferase [Candidatus Daviesbacteria bacterium]